MARRDEINPLLPFITVTQSARASAALLAPVLKITHQHAIGSLVELWFQFADRALLAQCGDEIVMTDDDARERLHLAFGTPVEPSMLAVVRFLEKAGDGWRLKGGDRLIAVERARLKKKGATPGRTPGSTRVAPPVAPPVAPGSDPRSDPTEERGERREERGKNTTSGRKLSAAQEQQEDLIAAAALPRCGGYTLTDRLAPAQCNALLPRLVEGWRIPEAEGGARPATLDDLIHPWLEWLKSPFAASLDRSEPFSIRVFVSAKVFPRCAREAGWERDE